MPAPAFVLGIDVGRDGLGLTVLSGDGKVAASLRRAYGADTPQILDAQDWWRAARTGIKEILRRAALRPDQVRAIGLSGESDAIVLVDREGNALAETSFGPDLRVSSYVETLTRVVGARNLANLASGLPSISSGAVKLLWLKDQEKRVWHDCVGVFSAKDFLRLRLTGMMVTDASDAAATLLFNPKTRSWSKQLLTLLGINPAWLPTINNGQAMSGRVTDVAARESGLQVGTPIVTGAGHAAALAVASGVLAAGAAMVELAGRGTLFAPTAEAVRDPRGKAQSTCHCIAGTWAISQSDVTGIMPLEWIMSAVMPAEVAQARRNDRNPIDLLTETAVDIPIGSDDLCYISPSTGAPGSFIGLDHRHGRGHLIRATLEGGIVAARDFLAALADLKRAPETVVAAGPGASNHLWCQMLADGIGRPVHAVPGADSPAVGAALLALVAVGVHKSVEEASSKITKNTVVFQPRRSAAEAYAALAPRLRALALQLTGSAAASAPSVTASASAEANESATT